MAIPPDIKIRLEQLRQEAAARLEAQLRQQQAQQNAEKMSKQFVPGKASGGQPNLDAMRLALNRQGMYSPLEKAAMAVPRTKGTPAEFMAEVSKQPGFRKEEVEDRKVSLPQQKMTKADFVKHVQSHKPPEIEERVLGGNDYEHQLHEAARYIRNDEDASFYDLSDRDQQALKYDIANSYGYNPEPQYDDPRYNLPGGDNYREILLTLPQRGLTPKERDQKMWIEANARRGDLDPKAQAELEALNRKEKEGGSDYQSSHWADHPNVLAHIRLSDRRGPKGEKVLHVEEIQSDWHQSGRKEGYQGKHVGKMAEYQNLLKQFEAGTLPHDQYDHFYQLQDDLGGGIEAERKSAVPDAPFKKNWHELAMKHVLGMAAKGGYHGVAITPGEEQEKRWQEPGLRVQYDKTLPEFLNRLGKPHGAQVGTIPLKTPKDKEPISNYDIAESLGIPWAEFVDHPDKEKILKQFWQARKNATTQAHYFPITESLRQQIKTEGLPQYAQGGDVDDHESAFFPKMAKGGSVSDHEAYFFPNTKE